MNPACRSLASLAALAASALGLLLVLLFAVPARAQVSWRPAASCQEARAALPPVIEVVDPPAVAVDVTRSAGAWLATLSVRYANGNTGVRRISARSCQELGRALAVTLSLLDAAAPLPEAAAPLPEAPAVNARVLPEPARAAAAVARAPVVTAAPSASAPSFSPPALPAPLAAAPGPRDEGSVAPEQRVPQPRAGFVRASSVVGLAGSRFGEIGAALAGGGWLGPWGMQLELSGRRPLAKLVTEHDFTLQLERYAVSLQPCVRRLGALELAACVGPRLELMRGLALGPSQPASDVVWLPGVSGGARLRLPVSRAWSLSAELQSSWSLRRAQASVAPWGKVYELPRLGAGLLLGAEWAL